MEASPALGLAQEQQPVLNWGKSKQQNDLAGNKEGKCFLPAHLYNVVKDILLETHLSLFLLVFICFLTLTLFMQGNTREAHLPLSDKLRQRMQGHAVMFLHDAYNSKNPFQRLQVFALHGRLRKVIQ